MKTLTKEMQASITPDKAIALLKEGNRRFLQNSKLERDHLQQASETSAAQYPFAIILSCIDSRTPAELIFDQGIGDLFSVRIAGNIMNEDILGSLEFGCKLAGSKVIVVLGHSSCGAVKGACDQVEMGNLTSLLKKIEPAISQEKQTTENRNSSNEQFVKNVTEINVKRTMEQIKSNSPILKEMLGNGEINLIGGVHDLASGEVIFF